MVDSVIEGNETEYNQKIQEAVAADEAATQPELVTLSSGVVLKHKQVSILRLQNIISHFKMPEVPALFDKERNKEIRNPNHPVYLAQVEQVNEERMLAAVDALIATGTELVECPEDIEPIDSDDWIEECETFFKIKVLRDNKKARYLAWVKYVAVLTKEDLELLAHFVRRTLGVSEESVAQAMRENFPNN